MSRFVGETQLVLSTSDLRRSSPARTASRGSVPTDTRTKLSQEAPYPIPGTTATPLSCSNRVQNDSESSVVGAIETKR
jgi:hypothetical protein